MRLPAAPLKTWGDLQINFDAIVKAVTALEKRIVPLRVVNGQVNGGTGAGSNGSGFTSVRTAVGTYTITFVNAWTTPYLIQMDTDQGAPITVAWTAAAAGSFVAHTSDLAGVAADKFFNFRAEEIR